jgi:hypothetical protein
MKGSIMAEENDGRSVIVQKFHNSKKIFLINLASSGWIIIFLFVLGSQINKTGTMIQNDLKENVITVHDTVVVKTRSFYCWQCKKELSGVNQGPVKCCGFEYTVKNGELFGKKIEE